MRRPSRSASSLALAILAPAAAALCAACSTEDSSFSVSVTVVTTAISVEPEKALGSLECSAEEGGLRSYVVTVFDHTDPTHIATLASSPPTPCSQGVAFRYILPDHIYTAEIDGYEALAQDLIPATVQGELGTGSRHMVLADGASVAPRWTGACGAVTAALHVNVTFDSCSEPVDNGVPSPASIRVDPLVALGDLGCASSGGDVASFDITPADPSLPPITGLACGAKPVVYSAGIKPGEPYDFRLEARAEQGGPIVWGASCSVLPKDGIVNDVLCDPLSSSGSIELSIADLLTAKGLSCGVADGDIATFEAVLAKPDLTTGPVACGDIARISPLPAADYALKVTAYNGKGQNVFATACQATVAPGTSVTPTCQ